MQLPINLHKPQNFSTTNNWYTSIVLYAYQIDGYDGHVLSNKFIVKIDTTLVKLANTGTVKVNSLKI